MNCTNCTALVDDATIYCQDCGYQLKAVAPPESEYFQISKSSKFFHFLDPVLGAIDDGSFFKKGLLWFYYASAVSSLLLALYVIFKIFDNNILGDENLIRLFIIIILVIVAWLSFQIYWHRANNIKAIIKRKDEFSATPIIAHLILTTGEIYGFLFLVLGLCINIVAIFKGDDDNGELRNLVKAIPYAQFDLKGLLIIVIISFSVIIFFRMIAELLYAITAIANNTKK